MLSSIKHGEGGRKRPKWMKCISNIGPGFNEVGPYGSYGDFSNFSKFILSLEMIAGRLELFPMLILFNPKTWSRRI